MIYFLFAIGFLLSVGSAYAICPVCIVAVGAGVGIAEEFGVDDTIVGLWVGALIIAMAWWTVNWLIKKNKCFKGCGSMTFLAYYLLTLVPLYSSGLIGKELNKLWGIDRLLFGVVIGSLLFYVGTNLHFYLKAKNNDRVYFPFQKVVLNIAVLLLASGIFYLLIG
ncbi:MAG: hypothetical protein ACYC3G_03400 [Minisyncoccota bacterium]